MYYLRIETNLREPDDSGERICLGPYGPFSSANARNSHAFEFGRAVDALNDQLGLQGPERINFSWSNGGQFGEDEVQLPQEIHAMVNNLRNIYLDLMVQAQAN